MSLYRSFMRLRYRFPSKQGRSVLKRSTSLFFTLRQVEYDAIEEERGTREAQQQSAKWREEAHDDFRKWRLVKTFICLHCFVIARSHYAFSRFANLTIFPDRQNCGITLQS